MVPCERSEGGGGEEGDAVLWAVELSEVVVLNVILSEEERGGGGGSTATAATVGISTAEAETVTLRLLAKEGGDADVSLCLAVADQGVGKKQNDVVWMMGEEEEEDVAAISRSMLLRGSAGEEAAAAAAAAGAAAVAAAAFPGAGMAVGLEPCVSFPSSSSSSTAAATQQQWLREGSMLMPVQAPHLCLAVVRSNVNILNTGIAIELAACNETHEVQQWTIKEKTTVVGREGGNDEGNWRQQPENVETRQASSSSSSSASPHLLINNWQQQCLAPETDAPPGAQEIWMGPLSDNAIVVLLFNRSPAPARMSAKWSELGILNRNRKREGGNEGEKAMYDVRDLWARKTLSREAVREGILEWEVQGHGAALFKLTPVVE